MQHSPLSTYTFPSADHVHHPCMRLSSSPTAATRRRWLCALSPAATHPHSLAHVEAFTAWSPSAAPSTSTRQRSFLRTPHTQPASSRASPAYLTPLTAPQPYSPNASAANSSFTALRSAHPPTARRASATLSAQHPCFRVPRRIICSPARSHEPQLPRARNAARSYS